MIVCYDRRWGEVDDWKGFEGVVDEKEEGKELYLEGGYVGEEEIVKEDKMNGIIWEKG